MNVDAGSFRDRDSRVVDSPDGIFRVLSEKGAADWLLLRDSKLLAGAMEEGLVVPTREVPLDDLPHDARAAVHGGAAAALRHERIPFLSYPYEWPFAMLRAAALLQLDLGLRAIDEGMTLKDSSAYNVQFLGSRPTFIDVGSFERLRPDEPWAGYRQFCMLFLYPLMLQAYRGVSFRPLLRGSVDGIEPQQAARLFSLRDRLRRGVLTHVALHARLERRNQTRSGGEVKEEIRKAEFKPELVKANMRRLRKLVTRLEWEGGETAWSGYRDENSYSDEDSRFKEQFVREALSGRHHRLVWDLGCNDGTFSKIAADFADTVVACDGDEAVVDALYRSLPADQQTILPLVVDLVDSSPSLGWRGRERRRLEERGRPDTVLALALVHHLSITGNVPLEEILDWFHDLGGSLVIEFPDRTDPMTQRLLAGKAEGSNADYGRENFERLLESRFAIEKSHPLPSGSRFLYVARPT